MLLNGTISVGVIASSLFAFCFGLVLLFVHHRKWNFIRDQPYRKLRGLSMINLTSAVLGHVIGSLLLGFVARGGVRIKQHGCIAVITYEVFQLLNLSSWFFVRLISLQDSIRMYRWPRLNSYQACLVGHLSPMVIVLPLFLLLFLKVDLVLCQTADGRDSCSIDSCSISGSNKLQYALTTMIMLPLFVIIFTYMIQHVRTFKVANTMWNKQHLSFTEKVTKYKDRSGLQRDQIYIVMLTWIAIVTAILLFADQRYSQFFKPVYSIFFSSTLIVFFVVECLMGRKVLNPLIWIYQWWLERKSAERRTRKGNVTEMELETAKP